MAKYDPTFFKGGYLQNGDLQKELANISLEVFATRITEYKNSVQALEYQVESLKANFKKMTNFIWEKQNQRNILEAQLKESPSSKLMQQIQQIDIDINYINEEVKRHQVELPELETLLQNCKANLSQKMEALASTKSASKISS